MKKKWQTKIIMNDTKKKKTVEINKKNGDGGFGVFLLCCRVYDMSLNCLHNALSCLNIIKILL